MVSTMAKKREPKPVQKPHAISFKPPADLAAALANFRAIQEFDPGPSAIIDRALRMFLGSKGYELSERPPDTD
jgi:hypothetical protein